MPLLILSIGIILVILNYYSIKKEKKTFKGILNNQSHIEKDYDVEIIAIRKDMAESILDLQKEIQELREYIDSTKSLQNNLKVKKDDIIDDIESVAIKVNKDDKVENIKAMINSGYSDDEICNMLKIGKGEVLLIKSLFK